MHASRSFIKNAPIGTRHSRASKKQIAADIDPKILEIAFRDKKPKYRAFKKQMKTNKEKELE